MPHHPLRGVAAKSATARLAVPLCVRLCLGCGPSSVNTYRTITRHTMIYYAVYGAAAPRQETCVLHE